jgi:DNA-binding beta-propeller fold protein YncE
MKLNNLFNNISLIIVITFISNCGDKFDLNNIEVGDDNPNIGGDTLYVQLNPAWEGFNQPQDVFVGREPLIYVADTENNRVVMLNLAGQILSSRSIKHPVAIAQDHRLNLIVCAQFDTSISGLTQTFSAVYKLDLVSVNHQLEIAPIKRILPKLQDFTQPLREYTGAAAFFDNKYYISRKGPNNSNLIDPDNSVLIFVQKRLEDGTTVDSLIGRVPLLDPTGSGINSANKISSLTSFNLRNFDMILTLTGDNSFKTQWLQFVETPDFAGYVIALAPLQSDLMIPSIFDRPEGAAVDNSGNIFVADAEKDSIFKFNAFGDELESFGGSDLFNQPYGVSVFNETVYVADTGNNRILRFKLSTDF